MLYEVITDCPEFAGPGGLQDGPHVLFHEICVERDRHVPKLHVQLRILGGGETTVDMVLGDTQPVPNAVLSIALRDPNRGTQSPNDSYNFV